MRFVDRGAHRIPAQRALASRPSRSKAASGAQPETMAAVHRTGRTPSGKEFQVPQTTDMFATLFSPRCWGPAELLSVLCCVLTALSCYLRLPLCLLIVAFLFWRVSYNLGLGLLLRAQGERQSLVRALRAAPPGAYALLNWFAASSMPPGFQWERSPPEFNAWLAFRGLCLVILTNDGVSYLALAWACARSVMETGSRTSLPVLIACVLSGSILIALSCWAKAAAHNVLGDYAWYWGDFFFTQDTQLSFDGVFNLCPHPMYTVGYATYYGLCLLSRSHTLFLISLIAHAMQIAFLLLVEEPHMKRIYPSTSASSTAPSASEEQPKAAPPAPSRRRLLDPLHALAMRHAGLCLVLITVASIFALARPRPSVSAVAFVAWRLLHWGVLGSILYRQTRSSEWTKHFSANGISAENAFQHWRWIWTLSYSLNHLLFVLLALSIPSSASFFATPSDLSRFAAGIALIAIGVYTTATAHQTLGNFGFSYGDFFLSPPKHLAHATYAGPYRFINNPEAGPGYLAYYGIALARSSWPLFCAALIAHFAHLVFVIVVEAPHVRATYPNARPAAAFVQTARAQHGRLANAVPLVAKLGAKAAVFRRYLWHQICIRTEQIYTRMVCEVERQATISRKAANALRAYWDENVIGNARNWAKGCVSQAKFEGVLDTLQKLGVDIQPVGGCGAEGDPDVPMRATAAETRKDQ